MSSIGRGMLRKRAKEAFKKFRLEWRTLEQDQRLYTTSQKKTATKRGEVMLGKCPTFSEWNGMVKRNKQATPEDVQEHVDLTWEEDEDEKA